MNLELTDVEREFLLSLLQDRLGELKEEEPPLARGGFHPTAESDRAVRSRADRKTGSSEAVTSVPAGEAVKKWDWLRASTAPNPGNIEAREVPVPIFSQPRTIQQVEPARSSVAGAGRRRSVCGQDSLVVVPPTRRHR